MPFRYRNGLPLCRRSGVYSITNKVNGKVYVGSALSVRGRMIMHRSLLRKGRHENEYLQRAWNKYGENNFRFDVLEVCEPTNCIIREQYWMDSLKVVNRKLGYNICPIAGNAMGGRRHSAKSRAKMSKQRKGMDTSVATAAAAIANRGRKRSQEICDKISAGHLGKVFSEEHKANSRANHWSTKPGAAEKYAKIVATRPQTLTEEHKANIGAGHWVNRPDAEEIRKKLSKSLTGQKRTLASRQKMRLVALRRWAKCRT